MYAIRSYYGIPGLGDVEVRASFPKEGIRRQGDDEAPLVAGNGYLIGLDLGGEDAYRLLHRET